MLCITETMGADGFNNISAARPRRRRRRDHCPRCLAAAGDEVADVPAPPAESLLPAVETLRAGFIPRPNNVLRSSLPAKSSTSFKHIR
uniref:Uncharacterized protein n=1 Tax=Oryza brachyantha TaxID=4533 RepID=J3N1H9_ORYBR